MRLADVCKIQSGYTARGRLEDMGEGGTPVISLKDFSRDGALAVDVLHRVRLDGVSERFFCRSGDIVFRSRGERNTASVLSENLRQSVVPLLPLMIIRPLSSIVLSDYLAWFINSPGSQAYFDAEAQGTSLRMISKASLSSLPIDIPSISVQQKIVDVAVLLSRERAMMADLSNLRERMVLLSLKAAASKYSNAKQKVLKR